MHIVMIPGIDGSGEEHWQSHWERELGSAATRITPISWSAPDLPNWSQAITEAVQRAGDDAVLVAHSLGCLAAAYWLRECRSEDHRVVGAFLVAPPNPVGPSFPSTEASSFVDIEIAPLVIPGLVVSSRNDPYCDMDSLERLCQGWGLPRVVIGDNGHINSSSGLGDWAHGWQLLTAFLAGLDSRVATPAESRQ